MGITSTEFILPNNIGRSCQLGFYPLNTEKYLYTHTHIRYLVLLYAQPTVQWRKGIKRKSQKEVSKASED